MEDETTRLKKAVNWLIYTGKAENERAIAELLGYTKSSFSQIMNGKVPLSDRFLDRLCSLDPNINKVWIKTGEGNLTSDSNPNGSMVEIQQEAWSVIKQQAASLAEHDKQMSELISMLREQMEETKKMVARAVAPVGSAAAAG